MRASLFVVGLVAFVVLGFSSPKFSHGEEAGSEEAGAQEDRVTKAEAAIRAKLAELDSFVYEDMPLKDIVEDLKQKWDFPILLDGKALEEASISPDQPISIQLPKVTRKSGLKLILEPLELTYVVREEVLQLTTTERAKTLLTVRYHDVRDLVAAVEQDELKRRKLFGEHEAVERDDLRRRKLFGDHDASELAPATPETKPVEGKPAAKESPKAGSSALPDIKPQFGGGGLMRSSSQGGMMEGAPTAPHGFRPSEVIRELIMETISPDTWEPAGGPARISIVAGAMVVSQTTDVHEEIEVMLSRLRKILLSKPANQAAVKP